METRVKELQIVRALGFGPKFAKNRLNSDPNCGVNNKHLIPPSFSVLISLTRPKSCQKMINLRLLIYTV